MKNRDRGEINAMILDIASHGRVTKTKIMYRAYLSYNKLEEYLTDLGESEYWNMKLKLRPIVLRKKENAT